MKLKVHKKALPLIILLKQVHYFQVIICTTVFHTFLEMNVFGLMDLYTVLDEY